MPADFRDRKTTDFPFREEKENRNTAVFRGFLPVLWLERHLAGSDSEVFRSALCFGALFFGSGHQEHCLSVMPCRFPQPSLPEL